MSLCIPDSDNWVLETESLCMVANSVREYLPVCSAFTQQTPSVVQGSRFFIICHIHNHTSIISSEMQVELKKNTAFT